jgi:hypothetical protein
MPPLYGTASCSARRYAVAGCVKPCVRSRRTCTCPQCGTISTDNDTHACVFPLPCMYEHASRELAALRL